MMLNAITANDLKMLAKQKGVEKIDRMSSAEFRALMAQKQNRSSTGDYAKQKYSFTFSIKKIQNGYLITIQGLHLSNNRLNALPLKQKISYKNAIKKAAKEYWLLNKKLLKQITAFERATVGYVSYVTNSRDDGNNSDTIKAFQDTFSLPSSHRKTGIFGLIIDDNRKHLKVVNPDPSEIVCNEYKIEAYLVEGWEEFPLPL